MSDPPRGVLGNLAVLAALFALPALALLFLGSAWARAGAAVGTLAGIWLSGRRDPPPFGRLLRPGPAGIVMGEAARAYVTRLRAQRRRLPAVALASLIVEAAVAGAGALAGHPRFTPFTGGGAGPGEPPWILHQAGLALVSAWFGLLAGVSTGWVAIVLSERKAVSPGEPV